MLSSLSMSCVYAQDGRKSMQNRSDVAVNINYQGFSPDFDTVLKQLIIQIGS